MNSMKVLLIAVLCLCLMGGSIAKADDLSMSDEDAARWWTNLNPIAWYSDLVIQIALWSAGGSTDGLYMWVTE